MRLSHLSANMELMSNILEVVRQGARSSLVLSCGAGVVAAVFLIPLGPFMMQLFSQSPGRHRRGHGVFKPHHALLLDAGHHVRAQQRHARRGRNVVPMISSLAGLWLIRVPAAYFLAANFGRDSMYFCYALGWVPAIAIAWGFYLTGRWKRKAVVPQKSRSRKKVRLTGADFLREQWNASLL